MPRILPLHRHQPGCRKSYRYKRSFTADELPTTLATPVNELACPAPSATGKPLCSCGSERRTHDRFDTVLERVAGAFDHGDTQGILAIRPNGGALNDPPKRPTAWNGSLRKKNRRGDVLNVVSWLAKGIDTKIHTSIERALAAVNAKDAPKALRLDFGRE